MLKTALKTTSALALCAGLVTPPAFAQQSTEDLPLCALTDRSGSFPCVLEDGKVIKNPKALARVLANRAIGAQTGEAPADEAQTEEAPAGEAQTDEAPAAETTAAPEEVPVETPAAEAEPTPAEQTPAEAPAAEAEPTPAEQTPAEAPVAEVEPTPAEQTPAEAPADTAVGQPAPEPAAPDPTASEPTAPEPAAPQPTTEPAAEPTAPAADAAPAAAGAGLTRPKSKPAAPRTGPGGGKSAAAAAAAANAGSDGMFADPNAGAVTTETVTEADVRSSDQDFATAPNVAGAAPQASDGDDNFRKGLLIGLGALAVGAILHNGAKVVSNSGDRIVVEEPDGSLTVLKNDDEILRRPGSEVRTQTYDDGSTRTVVSRPDGVRIITVRAADGTALKRVRVMPNGERYVLFDDTVAVAPVETLPAPRTAAAGIAATDQAALREALIASMAEREGRRYGLGQVRAYPSVRALAPEIEVRAITFPTNSAAIPPGQAERLADLGLAIADVIYEVPGAVFLVEGHTDAVGSAAYNLALSDRRAESVALALGEYFDVPPENLITQGYGESDLKVQTEEANRQNRRVVVRNITPLLQ